MLSRFDGGCMVSVFPETPFAFFPLVLFLCRSSGDQSNRLRITRFSLLIGELMPVCHGMIGGSVGSDHAEET